MDLREVIAKVKTAAEGAHSSFHAGRRKDAEKYLFEITNVIVKCYSVPAMPAGDVTESATNEKQTGPQKETPAAPGGPAAQAGAVLPAAAAQQKALDQAGP